MSGKTLVLFDVDLTLIWAAGLGSTALCAAFRDLAGVELDRSAFDFQGRTDRSIHRQLVESARVREPFEIFQPRLVESYLSHLEIEIGKRPPEVLPGVPEALGRLASEGHALGLVTGNVERGARIKLGPVGLNPFFPAGGFGDRHDEREDVVREAIYSCALRYGRAYLPAEVVVVGDTERDVAAGRAAGTRTVGVATGTRSEADLAAVGADLALRDLTEVERLVRFLGR